MDKTVILIIDDDQAQRETLTGILTANGYTTLAAASGAAGLALLQTHAVALALIDLDLPDIPGLDVLSTITAEHPATAALVLTGSATLESAIEATNRGAFSYLVKPCKIEQLMLQIRRAIEKQQAEEGLRRSESLFRDLLESAPDAMVIVDDRHTILMVNRRFEAMFGYNRAEVIGKSVEMLIPPRYQHHRNLGREYILDPKLRDMGGDGEFYALKKDGSDIPVEISLSPLTTQEGLIVSATIHDVTERKEAEAAIRKSEAKFRNLLEAAPNSILIVNADHEILMVNRQFELMFGYDRQEVVGRQVEMLVPSRFARHREYGREYIARPELRAMGMGRDLYALCKDGRELPVEIGLSPLVTPDGLIVITTIIDITERKQAEAAHRQHIRSLERMELVNRAIRQGTDVERMLRDVVQTVFSIFCCDRAWLFYPCDPDAPSFRVPVEICRPEYPGAGILNRDLPMVQSVARDLRDALASEGPVTYVLGQERSVNVLTAEQFAVKSQMFQAIYPKTGKPWVFGMHQCSHPRIWTDEEKVLFKEIGRRVADGLSSVLFLRDLRESEERFSALVNQAADAIFLFDMDGKLLDVNQRACDSLGFARDELLTMTVLDIDLQSADNEHIKSTWITPRPDRPVTVEGLHKRKDGTTFPVEVRLGPLQLGDRQVILALARDISERKRIEALRRQTEEALAQSRSMLAHILDSVPQSIFWKDRDSVYLGCNEIFARQAGLTSPDEIIGKTDFDLPWQRDETEKYRADDREVVELNRPKPHIIETQRQAGGKRVWVDTTKIPLTDETGHVHGVLGVYEDITERLQAEEVQEKLQAQLAQAQKMESVGRLAGGVAHDFNNMLSVILGNAEIALMNTDSAHPHFAVLQEIRRAAQRSANLTRQLLAFARKQTVAPRVINLNETVEGMLKMLRRLIGEDIDLAWLPGDDLWPIRMDPSQIDQIMANLAVNARDAIDGVGKVTIESRRAVLDEAYCAASPGFVPGEYVLLAVSDNGFGMDRETLDKLFEPFFTTKETGKGTGLGLSTVYGIVKQNNGFVNVSSEPGVGTTFNIYLPRHKGEAEPPQPEGVAKPAARGHETVLLVEDEPGILEIIRKMLEGQGYNVLAAPTPGKAIALAEEHGGGIHLLITDVIMPEMNGLDLAERLHAVYPNLKCLFVSGYTADVIGRHGVLDKGVNFIPKPFAMHDLAGKVREVLEQEQTNKKNTPGGGLPRSGGRSKD